MKHWAAVTVALYALCIVTLATPLLWWASGLEGGERTDVFGWFFTYVAPLLVIGQAALLIVPVARAAGRPVARRSIAVSVIGVAIPLALLTLAALGCVALALFKEDSVSDYVLHVAQPGSVRGVVAVVGNVLLAELRGRSRHPDRSAKRLDAARERARSARRDSDAHRN